MDVEMDDEKDAINRAKHGYSLAIGRAILENALADVADPRQYDTPFGLEERRIAYGMINGRLFVCVYTMRGSTFV